MIDRCFILGRGASLIGFDFSILDKEYKISVNGFHGNPNAIVFLDRSFVKKHEKKLSKFEGDVYAGSKSGYFDDIDSVCRNVLQVVYVIHHREGMRDNHSGASAIEVALKFSNKIYLLGFDFNETNGRVYFDQKENHPCYKKTIWKGRRLKRFNEYPKDRVFNCNPNSEIKCFSFVDINQILKEN